MLVRVEEVVVSGKSEALEFKGTMRTRREAKMTVCAMLNQGGGWVLFGVTPQGKVAGLSSRHSATHQAGDTLIPATLGRTFSGSN